MELAGSIVDNLKAAVASARRLRGHPVHPDTLDFWTGLLGHARVAKRSQTLSDVATTEELIGELQSEVALRISA